MAELSRRAWCAAAFAAWWASGCAEDTAHLPWPPIPDGTRALLVGLELDDAFPVFAFDYEPGQPLRLEGAPRRVTLFAYPRTLAELGLSAGAVARGAPGACWSRPLAQGATAFHRALEDEAWSSGVAPLSPAVGFRVEAACPCATFEERRAFTLDLPINGRPRLLRGDGRLVLASSFGSVVWPLEEVSELSASVPRPNPVGGALEDAFLASDGAVWIAAGHTVNRWDPATGAVETSTNVGRATIGLHGGDAGGGLELIVAANGGLVYRLRSNGWAPLAYDPSSVAPDSDQRGQVLWLGPARARVVPHDTRLLISLEPGEAPRTSTRESFSSISNLLHAPDGTVLAAARVGAVGVWQGERLTELPGYEARLDTAGELRRLFTFGPRVGLVAERGFIGEVYPELGVCPMSPAPGFERIFDAAGDERGVWVAGREAGGERLRVARYEPRED